MARVRLNLRVVGLLAYTEEQLEAGLNKRRGNKKPTKQRERLKIGGQCCVYCISARATTRDHVIPRSRGGTIRRENQVPACAKCNGDKGDKTILEFLLWRQLRSELGSARKATRHLRMMQGRL